MNIKSTESEKLLKEYKIQIVEHSGLSEKPFVMESVVDSDNNYVGDIDTAKRLFERGILPEVIEGNKVCSIGKSYKDGKWYGWSHRAIYGFNIGDTVKEGDLVTESGYVDGYILEHPEKDLSLPVGFTANTEEDCKRMAIAFACSVA